jgi:hypothetical protein
VLALIDESILLPGHGCYLLACVVIPDDSRASIRRKVRRAAVGSHFHWKDERDDARLRMLRLASDQAAQLIVLACRPTLRREHERARAQLLTDLLEELAPTAALDLLIESRQHVNDLKDRRVIAATIAAARISPELNYGHTGPNQEPLLWLPDALAGAAMAQVRGDGRYLATFPAGLFTMRMDTLKNAASPASRLRR